MKNTMHTLRQRFSSFSDDVQQRRFLDAARPAEEDALRASDWVVDAGIALIAFLFGCGQLFLASTSVIYVDGPFREMAGLVNIVPNMYAYGALAFTTLPLVRRRGRRLRSFSRASFSRAATCPDSPFRRSAPWWPCAA